MTGDPEPGDPHGTLLPRRRTEKQREEICEGPPTARTPPPHLPTSPLPPRPKSGWWEGKAEQAGVRGEGLIHQPGGREHSQKSLKDLSSGLHCAAHQLCDLRQAVPLSVPQFPRLRTGMNRILEAFQLQSTPSRM